MFLQLLTQDPIRYFWLVAIIIFSICWHELAHGYMALSQGDDTPDRTGHMTANPIVHMGWESIVFLCIGGLAWGAMPVNPAKFRSKQWGEVLVSAAGPLSNLVLGFVFMGLLVMSMQFGMLNSELLRLAAQINLSLCLFNLLPIPPLDGFHIFRKFFPELKVLDDSNYGLFALMLLMVLGLGTGLYLVSALVIEILTGYVVLG